MKKFFASAGIAVIGVIYTISLNADTSSSVRSKDFLAESLFIHPDTTDKDHLSRLEQQNAILDSTPNNASGGFIKNKSAVEQSTKYGIVFTQKTIESFKKDFEATAPVIDLFELDNLRLALLNVLNKGLNEKAGEAFPSDIREQGTDLYKALDELQESLANNWSKEISAEKIAEQQIEQQRLWYTYKALKDIHKIIEERTKISATFFAKFIYGMMVAYKVAFLRLAAAKILEASKPELEDALLKNTVSKHASVGVEASYAGAKAGISASVTKSEEMTDTSFYQISLAKDLNLNVGAGIGKLFAQLKVGMSVANAAIFYSLEQLMDSGKFSGSHLKLPAVKEVAKSRQKMQKREKELLSIFSGSIEAFLKDRNVGLISSFSTILFPIITKSAENETAKSSELSVGGELSIASVGLTLTKSFTEKTHTKKFGILSLIEDDCSPAVGYKPSDITALLGSTSDKSAQHLEKIAAYKDDDGNYDEMALVITLNNILEDLRRYNDTLAGLAEVASNKFEKADKKKKEELENEKHAVEARWLVSNSRLKSEGREGVLRAFVATAVNIRGLCSSTRTIGIFNQIYNELGKLATLCEFSKDKSKQNAEFGLEAEASNSAWNGSLSLPGGIYINLSRVHSEGHPSMEDNGEFIDLEITLPMTILGLIGMKVVQTKLLSVFGALSKQKSEVSEGLGNAGTVVQDVLLLLARNSAIPFISNVMSMIPIGTSKMSIRLRRLDVFECAHPLPGTSVLIDRNKNRWEVLYIQTMALSTSGFEPSSAGISDTLGSLQTGVAAVQDKIGRKVSEIAGKVGNAAAGLGEKVGALPVNLQLSFGRSLGRRERIIGSNALFYPTARYNVAMLGNSKTQWENFTSEQAQQLWLLFANICNADSDARYELQVMYNKILDNAKNSSQKDAYSKEFEEFLKACDTFSDLPTASKAFVDFLPLYNTFAKSIRKCQDAASKLNSIKDTIKFSGDALLAADNSEKLSFFIDNLQKCRTSSDFQKLCNDYKDTLKWCCENSKGKEHSLLQKLRKEIKKSNKCYEKMLKKKYFEVCKLMVEKAYNCRSSSQYSDLLREFRRNIKECPESPLKLVGENTLSQTESDDISLDLEEFSEEDTEIDETSTQEKPEGTKKRSGNNDNEELPSNYEKVITELDSSFLKAVNSAEESGSFYKLMQAIAESKKGIPADYAKNEKSIEKTVKAAMASVTPELVEHIASINIKIQKLLAEIVLFNKGALVLFALLRAEIDREYKKTLEAFNKVLRANYETNFLPERNKRFGVRQ